MNREEEARRALNRLEQESEKLLGSGPAEDSGTDPTEILGRRIARMISVALAAAMMFYLWYNYL
jgi:hypothetical protein